jgi:tRNA nucleotidyltransferase (CCA-adding enzyme)
MDSLILGNKIEKHFPSEALVLIKKAAEIASGRGEKIYLVGGAVRDLLLKRPVLDIDLVVEGDAIAVAEKLASAAGAGLNSYKPFLTATVTREDFSIDLATARSETYPQPGALPRVTQSSLQDDLRRRDFSINAIAASLNINDFGTLFDLYGGVADLKDKLIRVLHNQSFADDATRIWRAVRYEQRLDFRIEDATLRLLKRDLPMLRTISGERIWYELECILSETAPEKPLKRADELGVLQYVHPSLKTPVKLAKWFDGARRISRPQKPPISLYLALLTYNPDTEKVEQIAEYLKLDKQMTRILTDCQKIKENIEVLDEWPLQPSATYLALDGHDETAIIANLIASESDHVRKNIQLYLKELRYVKVALNGDSLLAMGLPQGPIISAALNFLLDARLDGEVKTRQDEVRLIEKEFLGKQ